MPHPRHLGQILTAAELEEWAVYAALVEGFGEAAHERRAAALIAARFEIHRNKTEHPGRFEWGEFAGWTRTPPPPPELTPDQQVEAFDRAFGLL